MLSQIRSLILNISFDLFRRNLCLSTEFGFKIGDERFDRGIGEENLLIRIGRVRKPKVAKGVNLPHSFLHLEVAEGIVRREKKIVHNAVVGIAHFKIADKLSDLAEALLV